MNSALRDIWPGTRPYENASSDEWQRAVEDGEAATDDGWPEPEPLGSELPPVPQFNCDLLPTSLRPLVEDVAQRMQVPSDFPAIAAILSLAGVTNRRAVIQPKEVDTTWIVVPNLWGGIVAPPGLLKSPVIRSITKPLAQVDALWRAEYESALADYKSERERYELQESAWKQLYTAAVKKDDPLPIKPDTSIAEPKLRRLITQDATAEKLHEILRDNPAGIFIVRDELAGWFVTLEKHGREGEREFFLSAWNGDTGHTIDRIGRGSIHVPACCVSILGGIPPSRLTAYMADTLKDGPLNDGLMQRFQLLVWPDASDEYEYIDRKANHAAINRAAEIFNRIAGMDSENPLLLKFAPDAQELFKDWLSSLEERLRGDDLPSVMQAHLAKFRSLMPSLALLLSLADGELEAVSKQQAEPAIRWCAYLEEHAKRIYASRITPEQAAAMTLARKLVNGWKQKEGSFALRDVYRACWTGLGTPEEARAALLVLEESGWVRREFPEESTLGRPTETYAINPRIKVHRRNKHSEIPRDRTDKTDRNRLT